MVAKAATKVLLTKEEQKLLSQLAPDVQALFKGRVESETLDSYETEEELIERLQKASYEQFPEVKGMLAKFSQSANLADFNLEKMPEGAMDNLLFSIGACGISALIETSLQDKMDKEAVEAIATLSVVRHRVLTVNSSK